MLFLYHGMVSTAEVKTGAVFFNYHTAVAICQIFVEMVHSQLTTSVHVDDTCSVGIINDTFHQRKSKSMNIRFYWIHNRVRQDQFHIFWGKGSEILADASQNIILLYTVAK